MKRPHSDSLSRFWYMLTQQEQQTLGASAHDTRFALWEAIIREGIATSEVAIIRSGWAVSTVNTAGRTMVLRLYGPGDIIGVQAALTGAAPTETVTAGYGSVHAIRLTIRRFADFIRQASNASIALHHVQQNRLDQADRIRIIRDYPTRTLRLAGLLAELSRNEYDPIRRKDGSLQVPPTWLSQCDLGSWIGDSRKTVSRALADLRSQNLVATDGAYIVITDVEGLRALAQSADAGSSGMKS